ncbi:MAG: NADH-ubiquinone oxidoreductase-F iron-sulfur binding region domain-containing protein [Acidimicrobiales bacterium]
MTLALRPTEIAVDDGASAFGIGEQGARLLAGPLASAGAEPLGAHLARLGALPQVEVRQFLDEVAASGLAGRGGGGFPVARKVATARAAAAGKTVTVVVNASESEPASRKDRTLCALRPHLVLDGAAVAAALAGASSVVIYAHRGADAVAEAFRRAAAERRGSGLTDPVFHLGMGPARYVAGEASAAASWLAGGEAKPRALTAPLAAAGLSGQPTVVHNAETLAHLALLARFGASWWAAAGTPSSPGSRLVTVHGGDHGATVLEVVEPVTVGSLLEHAAAATAAAADGWDRPGGPGSRGAGEPPVRAVLVGGYAGRFVDGADVATLPCTTEGLALVGAAPGCGLLAPLSADACGVATAARLARWLAGESAGQCGPCLYGLADVAEALEALVAGTSSRRAVRTLRRLLGEVRGKGACHHPDGAVAMVESFLDVFAAEVDAHARRRRCPVGCAVPAWPLPQPEEAWR